MTETKIKKLFNFRIIKLVNGIILISSLSIFPIFGAYANTDFIVSTTTANVPTGNTNQTIGITESVANVSVGEDNQTITIDTTTANVVERKASETITVQSLPAGGTFDPETGDPIIPADYVTIGNCVVTFTTVPDVTADQTYCGTNNTATIDTNKNIGNIDRDASEIATILSTLTGVTDPVHGALTPVLHGNSVTFTTSGAETSATGITFGDYTGGDIIEDSAISGILPESQVTAVMPVNIELGDTFTVIINGTSINYTAGYNTIADVTAGLAHAINVSSQSANVTATDHLTWVDVVARTHGTPFTISGGTSNRSNTVAQVDAVTPTNVDVGDTFTVIINGATINYTATEGTVANVTAGLTAAINSSSQASTVTATDHTVRLDVTADTPGVPFTITGGTTNRPPVAQISTVTPTNVKQEETVLVSINGTNYYYTTKVGDTTKEVAAGLRSAISSSDVAVSGTDNIILTANVAGTPFTVDAKFSEIVLSSKYGIIRNDIKIGNLSGKLRVGDITKNNAKIIWNTDASAEGTLYVSKIRSKLTKSRLPGNLLKFNDSTNSLAHGFALSGLQQNSAHYFIIVSGNSRSKIFSFKTQSTKRLLPYN